MDGTKLLMHLPIANLHHMENMITGIMLLNLKLRFQNHFILANLSLHNIAQDSTQSRNPDGTVLNCQKAHELSVIQGSIPLMRLKEA
ncbi:unnamed protein product [Larinioides sclopetarius]|uniref:Uncharacterized protein n=1 Tax=Larinioides sclopetarius TaxID=280406 RepID=A0AAV1Z068_9ARAC